MSSLPLPNQRLPSTKVPGPKRPIVKKAESSQQNESNQTNSTEPQSRPLSILASTATEASSTVTKKRVQPIPRKQSQTSAPVGRPSPLQSEPQGSSQLANTAQRSPTADLRNPESGGLQTAGLQTAGLQTADQQIRHQEVSARSIERRTRPPAPSENTRSTEADAKTHGEPSTQAPLAVRKSRFGGLFGLVGGRDMAIDLGTANTLIYMRGSGIVLNEPSVVAINLNTRQPMAIGVEAKRMIGRTPGHIAAIRPLKDGVIADFDVCEEMLRYFIHKVAPTRWGPKPRIVICVPSGITGVEQRAVRDAAEFAGAREAIVIEEPMAAAVGAGLPINDPIGSMVVDIGGGTTEVAIISLGGIVVSKSLRVGGDLLDRAVVSYIRREYNLALGERTAETIKIKMGSAVPLVKEFEAEIRGRDLITGLPKTVVTTTREIREGLEQPVSAIIDAVKLVLDAAPAELAADIMEKGVVLTGGGALLNGLADRLQRETGTPIRLASNPLHTVVLGSGLYMEQHRSSSRSAASSHRQFAG